MSPAAPFPHVSDWQARVVAKYGHRLKSTGGNDPLDLLNDLQRPESKLIITNLPRWSLAFAVSSQVALLRDLDEEGSTGGAPAVDPSSRRLALISIRDLREGDLVDLEETLEKYDGDYADKVAAEHEYATVESAEAVFTKDGVPTKYLLATDQVNLLLPWGEKVYVLV